MPLNAQRMAELRRRAMKGGAMSQRPPFNPPLGLWIAGVDFTAQLILDSPTIRSTAYSQTGVFTFRLDGSIGALAGVAVEQEVTFNKGGVVYAGRIRTITPEDLRPIGEALVVECQDFTSLLAESVCAYSNAYANPVRTTVETDQQRISWLLQSWDRYGITAYHVQTLTASMPPQDFTGMTLNNAIKAVLAFGNGSFYVDFSKDLHTFISETSAAPFGLSDTPDDATTFAFADFAYPKDSVDLVNAVYAIPGGAVPVVADAGTSVITTAGSPIVYAAGVLATFKRAGARAIQPVGVGTFTIGTTGAVSPPFAKPTTAGNHLVAWGGSGGADETTTSPGWTRATVANVGGLMNAWVWYKAKCNASETPPTFTSATSLSPMLAQLAEFREVATTAPLDRAALGNSNAVTVTPTSALIDAGIGDLIVMAARWQLTAVASASFAEALNNAPVIHVGDSGASVVDRHVSFAYGIISAAEPTWYTDEPSIVAYGRREASITDTSVTTQAGLDLLGAAYLAAHKNPLQHCSLKCRQPGLTAGMTINVTNALYGLVAQAFRIQGLTINYPDGVPEFEVQFADPVVTVASQMVAMQDQLTGDRTATSSDLQKLAAVVAANTLGTLAYVEIISPQSGIITSVDIAGLAATVNVGVGRRIRVTAFCGSFTGTVDADNFSVYIVEDVTALVSTIMAVKSSPAGGASRSWHQPSRDLTPSAGSHTYRVQAGRNNGTGSGTFGASDTQPGWLRIEDVGAA